MFKTLNPRATISRWACFKGTVETQQKYTPFKVSLPAEGHAGQAYLLHQTSLTQAHLKIASPQLLRVPLVWLTMKAWGSR